MRRQHRRVGMWVCGACVLQRACSVSALGAGHEHACCSARGKKGSAQAGRQAGRQASELVTTRSGCERGPLPSTLAAHPATTAQHSTQPHLWLQPAKRCRRRRFCRAAAACCCAPALLVCCSSTTCRRCRSSALGFLLPPRLLLPEAGPACSCGGAHCACACVRERVKENVCAGRHMAGGCRSTALHVCTCAAAVWCSRCAAAAAVCLPPRTLSTGGRPIGSRLPAGQHATNEDAAAALLRDERVGCSSAAWAAATGVSLACILQRIWVGWLLLVLCRCLSKHFKWCGVPAQAAASLKLRPID
jgi:hypothetical protein